LTLFFKTSLGYKFISKKKKERKKEQKEGRKEGRTKEYRNKKFPIDIYIAF
jgi:hypothetical protein